MPRIPQHERNILNYVDQELAAEISVWRIVKRGGVRQVQEIKKTFDMAFKNIIEQGELLDEAFKKQLSNDMFDLICIYFIGGEYEYQGYLKKFTQKFPSISQSDINYITKKVSGSVKNPSAISEPWSTILKRGLNYPTKSLRNYIDLLWYKLISDANFNPNRSLAMNEEQTDFWDCSKSILDDLVEPDKAQSTIKLWNDTTEANLSIGACIEGFYFDGDKSNAFINNQLMDGYHIIAIPKEIKEPMFDATIEYIKSLIFKKLVPIETVKDIYTHYLPTNLRTNTYKRQVIKNKSMVSTMFVGLFCDRLYETKIVEWKRTETKNQEIKNLHDAAECVAEFFTNIGFPYEVESVVNARKKFLKILDELDVNYY
ncbi:hypothetical protein I6F48_00225 [Pseudoalteromonas sp. SWYJ118]|uniref:hypothetical protein n=1 Tax=Pseudoalteromonas sp. SWYJ118 TaxID=2792062 RepID=UPI0018CF3D27|nr:hypothetical protein [Pseudoalteromonas sp. SWYJ118]MBH0073989.1 hypothetical protein [Pseudoalteromonas sp. SWYJ118]